MNDKKKKKHGWFDDNVGGEGGFNYKRGENINENTRIERYSFSIDDEYP